MNAVIDMRTWGAVNDAAADNTQALLSALARRDASEPLEIFFPAGDWHFSGPLPVGTHSDLSVFDNVTLSGVYTAPCIQHQEDPDSGNAIRDRSRLIIHLDDETDIWWNHVRSYRFGPLAFRDLTFHFPVTGKGSLFAFGDPMVPPPDVTLRGLKFERCYASRVLSYASPDFVNGSPWLIDAGAQGFVLNKLINSFALRLDECYETQIDLVVSGFKYGVINIHGDRITGSVRGASVGKLVEEYPRAGESLPVGSHWEKIYCEASVFAAAVLTGQCAQLRGEWGYNGTFNPDTGPRDMPAEVTWSITAEANVVAFTFPPVGGLPWGYDCTDYFEPRMPYRFAPADHSEPVRWLYVTKVDANQLTFADPTSKSYIPRAISGNGQGVLRPFGTGVILDGDRASVIDPSLGCNQARSNSPAIFVRPGERPVKVGGNSEERSDNLLTPTNLPVIIASSAGFQFTLQGGVDFLGSSDVPNHPLANPGGVGPVFDPNTREPLWDPATQKQLFRPGRGVTWHVGAARMLTFHEWGDPQAHIGLSGSATVDATALTPSATEFDSSITEPTDLLFVGRALIFTTGALAGRVANITAYRLVGGRARFTVRGLAAAPAAGNAFSVLGPPTPCYRPGDGPTGHGWELRRLRQSGVETDCKIRVYVPSGTPTLNVFGGAGSANAHVLAPGWQTITSRLAKPQVLDDSAGPFVRLTQSGVDFYIAWVEVDQNRPSGVYTPIVTGINNVVSTNAIECHYMRIGSTVWVGGAVEVSPNVSSVFTRMRMSLPITTNLGAETHLAGTGCSEVANECVLIKGDNSNERAYFDFYPMSVAEQIIYFTFTYRLI